MREDAWADDPIFDWRLLFAGSRWTGTSGALATSGEGGEITSEWLAWIAQDFFGFCAIVAMR